MRKLILPIFVSCLSVSFTIIPTVQKNNSNSYPAVISLSLHDSTVISPANPDAAATLYAALNLQQYGLSCEAFEYAWKGYQHLLATKKIVRSEYLTICDFSQSSKKKRFYLIDIANNKLVLNTYVTHGRNSGREYAVRFSNRPKSLQSSLGFYVTQNTYFGEHGLALKINGVDAGYNDKAFQRNIVIHGSVYAEGRWLRRSGYLGRSFGCPAIPKKESRTIINTIKNGTCLFIYHPGKAYLLGSKILNG